MLNIILWRAKRRRSFADDKLLKLLLVGRDGPAPTRHLAHRREGSCSYRMRYPGGHCPWCAALDSRLQVLRTVAAL